jgi:hypothetical protein
LTRNFMNLRENIARLMYSVVTDTYKDHMVIRLVVNSISMNSSEMLFDTMFSNRLKTCFLYLEI